MTKRIALLFEYPTLNGGERSMLQVLELIDQNELEIVALAPESGRLADALRQHAFRHVSLSLRDEEEVRLPRDEACERLVEAVSRASPDLVHANSLTMGRLTGSMADRLQIPTVAHLRDIMGLSRGAIADLNRNRVLIAVSQATRDFHIEQGLDPGRTYTIHNGIDSDRFVPRKRTGRLCRALNVPMKSFVILTVGQISLRKGQNVLAAAAPSIVEHLPEAQFVIVGERNSLKAESIAFERDFIKQFSDAGLRDRLHCLGYRNDVAQLMNEADLLVHPAKQEPLGRVLLEAAASGLPIIATAVGGTEEILANGESARLIASGEADGLVAAVLELASSRILRRRFSEAARRRVKRDFTNQATVQRLLLIWCMLLQSPTNQRIE